MSAFTVDLYDDVHPLLAEWDALADSVHATPWLRPGWIRSWWAAFGKGSLEILALRQGNRLVAVLPLQARRGSISSASNWHTPAVRLLASEEAARTELARVLFARGGRQVTLRFVPVGGGGLAESRAAAVTAGYHCLMRLLRRSPYLLLDGDVAACERRLAKSVRQDLRRTRRRLQEIGQVTLDVLDGTDRLDTVLREGLRIEAAGWKGARGTAIASQPATESFYREIAHWGAERGWLRLGFLRLDDRAIAFDFTFEVNGHHYLLKTGYDPAYRSYGPGKLLRYEMVMRAARAGLRSYEFLGGDDPFKLQWTDQVHEIYELRAFAPSLPGITDWLAWRYGAPLIKSALHRSSLQWSSK